MNEIGTKRHKKAISILAAIAMLTATWASSGELGHNPVIGSVIVQIEGESGDGMRLREIAKSMIAEKEGQRTSVAKFSRSVEALEQSNLFRLIEVPRPDFSAATVDLVFRLARWPRIKAIIISGGFPLLQQEIRNAMTIAEGDACIPQNLEKQPDHIETLFRDQGYIEPRVSIGWEEDPEDGDCVVRIGIVSGKFFSIQSVNLSGNSAFSDLRLKPRISTWNKSLFFGAIARFVQADLEKDIRALKKFYWRKGYCEATVEAALAKNDEKGEIEIGVHITEGPRYAVEMVGNEFYWDFTLKRDLVIFKQGVQDDFTIEKSLRNLKRRYRRAGFKDIRIETASDESEKIAQTVRKLLFRIEEGPRYIVGSVAVTGNQEFSDEKIRKQMLTGPPRWLADGAYVPSDLAEDIRAIQTLYIKNGYTEPLIAYDIRLHQESESGRILVDIDIEIEEGPRTTVSVLEINGLSEPMAKDVRAKLPLQKDDPYRERLMESSRDLIAARVSEMGYPHVKVDSQVNFTDNDELARVEYNVVKGTSVKMGQTFFTGNFKTRTRVFEREMDMEPGDPFSLSKMLSFQRDIRNINALATARFHTIGLEEESGRVDVLTEVGEKAPYFLEFAAGYDSRRLFYFKTGAGDINLLGLNKQLQANVELSQIGYAVEANLAEPKLFGTRTVADTSFYTEEIEELNKDFGLRKTGVALNLSRPLAPNIAGGLGFGYDFRKQYRTNNDPVTPADAGQYERRSVLTTTPSISYDSTDSFIHPTRGINSRVAVNISNGIENSLDDFVKSQLYFQSYYTPFDRVTFAFRAQGGYIEPYGDADRVPDDQLFFLGGTASVRGFDENRLRVDADDDPVGGRTALMASLETGIDIGMNFELVCFYDTGTVRDTNSDAGSSELRAGAGVGLRYITPIGAIGLVHGWKIDRKPGESPGAYHFTIGYAF